MKKRRNFLISLFIFILIIGGGWSVYQKLAKTNKQEVQYQTATAEKGSLITSVSASGLIKAEDSTDITTDLTGTITEVVAKDGDTVAKGQKIASLKLDQKAEIKKAQAWASYLSAVNGQKTAEQNQSNLEIQILKDEQSVLNAQNEVDYKNNNTVNPATKVDYTDLEKQMIDNTLLQAEKNLTLAKQKLEDSGNSITSAKAQVDAAWLAYQEYTNLITAPADGVIKNLDLTVGQIIESASNGANNQSEATSSSSYGLIVNADEQTLAQVNLAEVDVVKVQKEQKVTLTLDALPDKTFTGKVQSIDTAGTVSSGVTTYPVTVTFDSKIQGVYPNMAVTAQIITSVKNEVILVPLTAIQTSNNQTVVQVMKSEKPTDAIVEIGDSNDTQTEITSGITEGDEVVTQIIEPQTTTSQTSASPFSSFGGGGVRLLNSGGSPSARMERRE